MLYLTGSLPAKPELFEALRDEPNIGALLTPRNSYPSKPLADWPIAIDNGCFGANWDADEWREFAASISRPVLFATVPDVVGDCDGTRQRWDEYRLDVGAMPPAYVLQDGQRDADMPWSEMAALFIGGSTDYKLSSHAHWFTREAKRRDLWVHMGRVNSLGRMRIAAEWGCDSVDGNYLAFGPDINTPRLLSWVRDINNRQRQLSII